LTTSSETWESAAGDDNVRAANAASMDIFPVEITDVLPFIVRRIGRICLTGRLSEPACVLAINSKPASTRLA
jgi:hypothetical protein